METYMIGITHKNCIQNRCKSEKDGFNIEKRIYSGDTFLHTFHIGSIHKKLYK